MKAVSGVSETQENRLELDLRENHCENVKGNTRRRQFNCPSRLITSN